MIKGLVSIIIPCYNVQKYIAECIDSCLKQTYSHLEIICIDNNSTDNTVAILKQYQKTNKQIILSSESTQGPGAARNKGLSLAKGEWIQLLDADDLLLPNKIERQVSIIQPDIAFVAGACTYLHLSGKEVLNMPLKNHHAYSLFVERYGCTCSNLFNASVVFKTELQNERLKFSEETDFMLKLVKVCNVVAIDTQALTIIRERKRSSINKTAGYYKPYDFLKVRQDIVRWMLEVDPNFYHKNKEYFDVYLMTKIRALALFDIEKAEQMRKWFKVDKYQPKSSASFNTKLYAFLMNNLGFMNAERVFKLARKVFRSNTHN